MPDAQSRLREIREQLQIGDIAESVAHRVLRENCVFLFRRSDEEKPFGPYFAIGCRKTACFASS